VTDSPPAGQGDDPSCTAVLLSAPREVAERIGSFLRANQIPCRIRLNTEMTPERLLEESLRSAAPGASKLLDAPILGTLLRGRLADDLKAEIKITGTDIPPVWDVLVLPEDLPDEGRDAARSAETSGSEPSATPSSGEPARGATGPVVLCELPWEEAWRLTERLIRDGIPAAVMAGEGADRDVQMGARIVPVGVRPVDLDRARAYLE